MIDKLVGGFWFMKKFLLIALSIMFALALVGCSPAADSGQPADSGQAADAEEIAFQYKTADEVKAMIDGDEPMFILDICPIEDFEAGHLPDANPTYAYPADTPELQELLAPKVEDLKSTEDPIIVVCPGGGGGAKNTITYFVDNGVPAEKFFILQDGAKGWPYQDMLVQD